MGSNLTRTFRHLALAVAGASAFAMAPAALGDAAPPPPSTPDLKTTVSVVAAGKDALNRYGPELLAALPAISGLSQLGMPLVVVTTQDLQAQHGGPLPGSRVKRSDPEYRELERSFHALLSKLGLPEDYTADVRAGRISDERTGEFRAALENLRFGDESSTVVSGPRSYCILSMGDGRESSHEMAASFAASPPESLPRLAEIPPGLQAKWLLVHEARHCAQPYKDSVTYNFRLGDETDADVVANRHFPELAPYTLRQRAIASLHTSTPRATRAEEELIAANVHATALPLLLHPDRPYAIRSEQMAAAYRQIGKAVVRHRIHVGDITPDASLMSEVLLELAPKQAKPEDQEKFRALAVELRQAGDDEAKAEAIYRRVVGPIGAPPDALDDFLTDTMHRMWGVLRDPRVIAPVLQKVLNDSPVEGSMVLSPLARQVGALYLRAAADLNPALAAYTVPLPEGLVMPALPPASAKVSVRWPLLRPAA